MPHFTYVARDPNGSPRKGSLEGRTSAEIVEQLRRRGWLVVDVRPEGAGDRDLADWLAFLNPIQWLPVRSVDVEWSLHQLAVMLKSGMTLLNSLDTLVKQVRRPAMQQVWRKVSERIQQGSGLADAMKEHRCFIHLIIQLVRVGEQTGTLDQVLSRGAEALERRRELRTRLITAMIYPSIVVVMALGVTTFMLMYVIPQVQIFLRALGRKLPAMTQVLVDIADYIQIHGARTGIIILLLIAASVGFYLWPVGRMSIDRMALRFPVIGIIFRVAGTALFARAMSILVRSGVTILESLRTVEQLHRNRYLAFRVGESRERVMQGESLSESLAVRPAYMPMLTSMIHVGESAGSMDDTLEEVARLHERQLQAIIRRFSAMVEPAIILVVGLIVGYVYISFFVALFAAAGGTQ